MKRALFSLILTAGLFLRPEAQSLPIPRNIQAAYKNETRSPDGQPGKRYWQNHGRYDITIAVNPPDRTISGSEQITYINHSPDTLREIIMRLILNFHRPEALRYEIVSPALFTSGIQIDTFLINGKETAWRTPGGRTWQNVALTDPLLPGDSVQLSVSWHYELSKVSGREGMVDSTTYYIAYFYPRVSVYDDYYGWDRLDFTGYQEFYNDFNDYTLQVKVPKNFIVWATGTLQNPEAVLKPVYAQRLQQSMTSDSVIRIVTPADLAQKAITAGNGPVTWKWKADNVTDMAVGISDHYNWDAGSVIVDDATKRRASVQAAYKDAAADFHEAVSNAQYTLGWYSRHWPGVPYPYPKMTVFQGFADMEYPMMVNDASTNDPAFSRMIEDHEIAHTYFPFYMGINESRYPFMDEGWATTFELLIGRTERPVAAMDSFYKKFRVSRWINDPSQEEDVPIITPANITRGMAYGSNAYGKPSLAYLALKDMLGDELFKKCLQEYMRRWHGKHPVPWDFFYSFNNVSGKNLDWFWNNWFFSNHYSDLGVQYVKKAGDGYTLAVQNIGGFAIPFDISISYTDGSTERIHRSPAIWQQQKKSIIIPLKTKKHIRSLTLDNGLFMDTDESNNSWKTD